MTLTRRDWKVGAGRPCSVSESKRRRASASIRATTSLGAG